MTALTFAGTVTVLAGTTIAVLARYCYKQCGHNESIVVAGLGAQSNLRSCKIINHPGGFVWPFIQDYLRVPTDIVTVNFEPPDPMFTADGVAVHIKAVAQFSTSRDPDTILKAAKFYILGNHGLAEDCLYAELFRQTRKAIAALTADKLDSRVGTICAQIHGGADLAMKEDIGLTVVSFSQLQMIKTDS